MAQFFITSLVLLVAAEVVRFLNDRKEAQIEELEENIISLQESQIVTRLLAFVNENGLTDNKSCQEISPVLSTPFE